MHQYFPQSYSQFVGSSIKSSLLKVLATVKIKIEQGRLPQFQAVDLAHMEVPQKLGMVVTANTIICFSGKGCVDTLQTLLFEIKLMFKGANVLQYYIYIRRSGSESSD